MWQLVGGRAPPGYTGQGGQQLVAVLVGLHQQEVAEDHGLQLLLIHHGLRLTASLALQNTTYGVNGSCNDSRDPSLYVG